MDTDRRSAQNSAPGNTTTTTTTPTREVPSVLGKRGERTTYVSDMRDMTEIQAQKRRKLGHVEGKQQTEALSESKASAQTEEGKQEEEALGAPITSRQAHSQSQHKQRSDVAADNAPPSTASAQKEKGGEDEQRAEEPLDSPADLHGVHDSGDLGDDDSDLFEELFGERDEQYEESSSGQVTTGDTAASHPRESVQEADQAQAAPKAAIVEDEVNAKAESPEVPKARQPTGAVHESIFEEFLNRVAKHEQDVKNGIEEAGSEEEKDDTEGEVDDAKSEDENVEDEEETPRARTEQDTSDGTAGPSPPSQERPGFKRKASEGLPSESASKKRRDSTQTTPQPATQADGATGEPEAAQHSSDAEKAREAYFIYEREKLEALKAGSKIRITELAADIKDADQRYSDSIQTMKTAAEDVMEAERRLEAAKEDARAAEAAVVTRKREANGIKFQLKKEKTNLQGLERESNELNARAFRAMPGQTPRNPKPGFRGFFFGNAPPPEQSGRAKKGHQAPKIEKPHAGFGASSFGTAPTPGQSGPSASGTQPKPAFLRSSWANSNANARSDPFAGSSDWGMPKQEPRFGSKRFRSRQERKSSNEDDDYEAQDEDKADIANRRAENNGYQGQARQAPPPPPPPATATATTQAAALPVTVPTMAVPSADIDEYNYAWSAIISSPGAGSQTTLPCPLKVLDNAGLRTELRGRISSVRNAADFSTRIELNRAISDMHTWTLDNVVTMLTKIFFFDGFFAGRVGF
ncbi:hypothetical protein CLAFUW4_10886 [Fulvia fulva]|uniref:Uncharacterized protein n=1 Tax=Passalora fulva TaxID=5499 RepID=A0A9Q8URR4_PASFU|nr:uncharacterized protein CLAFUR5_09928 [Fulvia fulva]KAK4619730.1 hypothetical protein CLAFUR4_10891 [Fulvia fulva]KAK4621028.1 hypothetical protein CLAFUR0_10898 [Fulvia fulva]UJO19992.1 hypothetical protein CLAFUR5_09928 [Fulvia fulva]WPV16862.1 hypothetical protein CLAFUW4_10886 [Fulvia fulva]WPV32004.1 hypothetical protein CLAFUW7_10884 [Fulvia fulva]